MKADHFPETASGAGGSAARSGADAHSRSAGGTSARYFRHSELRKSRTEATDSGAASENQSRYPPFAETDIAGAGRSSSSWTFR